MAKKTLARKQKKRGGKRARKTQKRMKGGITPALLALALVLATAQATAGGLFKTIINDQQYYRGDNNLNIALAQLEDNNIIKYKDSTWGGPTVEIVDCDAAHDIIKKAVSNMDNSISDSAKEAIQSVYQNYSCRDGLLVDDKAKLTKAHSNAYTGLSIYLKSGINEIKQLEESIATLERAKPIAATIDEKNKNSREMDHIENEIRKYQQQIDTTKTSMRQK